MTTITRMQRTEIMEDLRKKIPKGSFIYCIQHHTVTTSHGDWLHYIIVLIREEEGLTNISKKLAELGLGRYVKETAKLPALFRTELDHNELACALGIMLYNQEIGAIAVNTFS